MLFTLQKLDSMQCVKLKLNDLVIKRIEFVIKRTPNILK